MQAISKWFIEFTKLESAGGILLCVAAVLAMLMANSPLQGLYEAFLTTDVAVKFGALEIYKPLLLWINDGLMAIFFFLVGLELKRELVEGELADPRNIILPGVGALGGMIVPALIYAYFNWGDPVAIHGWAIPAATDIAFALGVLTLLGPRVPISIKVFLVSLAIFDDIGAIIIIALFYTSKISMFALYVVAACLPVLWWLNRQGVASKAPYLLVGAVMWVATLKSGVHATLAGVVLAMFIPLSIKGRPGISPAKGLEHELHAVVTFFVLPVFAFANAGLSFKGVTMAQVFHSVPIGIAAGLFLGKQIGIFGFCWLLTRLKWFSLPEGMTSLRLYGTACLCGIGFTMSLFIGSLAFEEPLATRAFDERLGIIAGSLISGIFGFLVMKFALKDEPVQPKVEKSSGH